VRLKDLAAFWRSVEPTNDKSKLSATAACSGGHYARLESHTWPLLLYDGFVYGSSDCFFFLAEVFRTCERIEVASACELA
jgi:hypothetical protein